VAQTTLQLAILQNLTKLVRSGQYTANIGKPKAIVLVGHSFGSILSAAAVTADPRIAEGVILAGFSYNGTNSAWFNLAAGLRIANGESTKYSSFDSGYLTPGDVYADATTFFHAPGYDVAAVEWADQRKMPIGIGELTSLSMVDAVPKAYTGVAMILTGQFDFIFCQSQCDDVIEHPAAEMLGKAKAFKAVSFPGAGHGINFSKNAR
jgi:pimeloyl-ACP methyl ester carboxylesterase